MPSSFGGTDKEETMPGTLYRDDGNFCDFDFGKKMKEKWGENLVVIFGKFEDSHIGAFEGWACVVNRIRHGDKVRFTIFYSLSGEHLFEVPGELDFSQIEAIFCALTSSCRQGIEEGREAVIGEFRELLQIE
jgi:hypothetical protein